MWRRSALTAVVLLVSLSSCERRRRHQALAQELAAPASQLCRAWHREGGGCNADCTIWVSAEEATAALSASERLRSLSTLDDPEIAPLVANVRAASQNASAALKPRCSAPIERVSPASATTLSCAEARKAPEILALFAAVHALSVAVKASSGVELPNGSDECQP